MSGADFPPPPRHFAISPSLLLRPTVVAVSPSSHFAISPSSDAHRLPPTPTAAATPSPSYVPLRRLSSDAHRQRLTFTTLRSPFQLGGAMAVFLFAAMVYFLDGESILEETLSHFTSLSPRKRKKVLRLCLLEFLFQY
ncbi:unnamed protein product [Vicia faba]|uniref:Uncharacterized protein n=1 Tax=Vicia faba TaxID=3906 RepID=A0AAV1A5Z3_VICFA|nr:unnamed protein product [Vicia faba]